MPPGVELGRAGVKSILRSTLVSTLELPPKSHQPDPRSQPPTSPSPSTALPAADSAHAEQRDYEHELELALAAMARAGGSSGAGAPEVVGGEGVGEGEGRGEAGGGGEGEGEGEGGGEVGACVPAQILRAQHVTQPCEPGACSRDPTNAAEDDASAVTRRRLAWLRAGLEGSRARLSFARVVCFAPVLCNVRI